MFVVWWTSCQSRGSAPRTTGSLGGCASGSRPRDLRGRALAQVLRACGTVATKTLNETPRSTGWGPARVGDVCRNPAIGAAASSLRRPRLAVLCASRDSGGGATRALSPRRPALALRWRRRARARRGGTTQLGRVSGPSKPSARHGSTVAEALCARGAPASIRYFWWRCAEGGTSTL